MVEKWPHKQTSPFKLENFICKGGVLLPWAPSFQLKALSIFLRCTSYALYISMFQLVAAEQQSEQEAIGSGWDIGDIPSRWIWVEQHHSGVSVCGTLYSAHIWWSGDLGKWLPYEINRQNQGPCDLPIPFLITKYHKRRVTICGLCLIDQRNEIIVATLVTLIHKNLCGMVPRCPSLDRYNIAVPLETPLKKLSECGLSSGWCSSNMYDGAFVKHMSEGFHCFWSRTIPGSIGGDTVWSWAVSSS